MDNIYPVSIVSPRTQALVDDLFGQAQENFKQYMGRNPEVKRFLALAKEQPDTNQK